MMWTRGSTKLNSSQGTIQDVTSQWRRQYWGAKLLDAIQEHFETLGVAAQRSFVLPKENTQRAFLNNLFWRPSAYVLTPNSPPVFSTAVQEIKTNLREKIITWTASRKSDTRQENEFEIPRDIL